MFYTIHANRPFTTLRITKTIAKIHKNVWAPTRKMCVQNIEQENANLMKMSIFPHLGQWYQEWTK